ncbi:APC family permease [Streptomyces sp. NBC_01190]|uniref:APC family permease n=1 Tax=Streptomyces sp. NBC_01190 TaxID=2903767 RepID=UPI00386602FB|nr:APC family permease [Streptomyces sp. NBC_01190]
MNGIPLARRLGVTDAVVVGLGAMLGAGVFAAFGPAARAAGSGLLAALGLAAAVAYCNATSSARLAARYPRSGGTYVYGRERLGPFWGYLAGWSFVAGKSASCAAMALTVGQYVWPGERRAVAVAAVVALTAVNCLGLRKATWLTRLIVAVTLAVLVAAVTVCLSSEHAEAARLGWAAGGRPTSARGLLQAAGLLFFAFAGYARIATLGEEVKDPARTIPRAIPTALGITLAVYAAVAVALLAVLGPDRLAAAPAPVADAVRAAGASALAPAVRAGAAVAALGALLALILGVSRTVLAMARDRHFPGVLAEVRGGTPVRAELAVGAVVLLLTLTTDLRGAIGFSSFGVLLYYAVANASALRLTRAEGRPPRAVPLAGLAGCAVLLTSLPWGSLVAGAAVVAVGAALFFWTRR